MLACQLRDLRQIDLSATSSLLHKLKVRSHFRAMEKTCPKFDVHNFWKCAGTG